MRLNDNARLRQFFQSTTRDYAIVFVVFIAFITFAIITYNVLGNNAFLSSENALNMMRQLSIVSVLAAGQFFVIISGMIDLSVASTLALSGIFYAMVIRDLGIAFMPLAIVIALFSGMLVGLMNGVIVAHFKIPPFITTLGTMLF